MYQTTNADFDTVDAICICGTYFGSDGQPTKAMLARLMQALKLLEHFEVEPYILACGGRRGAAECPQGVTEAVLIADWLNHRGVHRVHRDELSLETIGNLAFAYLGFLQPLGANHAVFVTDSIHAPRVKLLADHVFKGLARIQVSAAGVALSHEEHLHQVRLEIAGARFVEAFLDDVPAGQPARALEWVSQRHHMHPYAECELSQIDFLSTNGALTF